MAFLPFFLAFFLRSVASMSFGGHVPMFLVASQECLCTCLCVFLCIFCYMLKNKVRGGGRTHGCISA
ncbi:hypothetical protein P691DRAFT_587110 [Macrolepiota fuliginosa MF-IS2]|uniref:Secreted protein n=1 Tax=Macrolepiota fuliginosa MF-IS2 TaxID=1400762 RepID=A0A9P6BVZ1_9AGAR|nr:hypothetical protein P691DRAFT_587110 [Macrolepiota fuliginosa MF-IS2]